MPSELLLTKEPITTRNKVKVYPATPCFLKKLKIFQKETIDYWENERNNYLNIKLPEEEVKYLRDYQKEGVSKILGLKGICGVFDEQRLGKTPMVLTALKFLRPKKTLIIVPKSLMISWEQECRKWCTKKVVAIRGTRDKREKLYQSENRVFITTYKTAFLDKDIIPKIDCMIIDEAHRLRNFKGMLSKLGPKSIKAIIRKSYECKYKIALTGTAAPNVPENIFPILHFLYPSLFPSYYKFREYYFNVEEKYINRDETILVTKGFKNGMEQELIEFLNYTTLQRKRKDYMKWIPPVSRKTIKLKLTQKESKWYNEIAKTFECEELGVTYQNLLTQMIGLRKIVAESEAKLEFILDYISDYPDESIIIASEHTSLLTSLKKHIPKAELIIGSTSDIKRKDLEDRFNKNEFKVLLGNIQCIKEGMKLENCSTIIIIDPSLTYTDNEQLEDRLLPTTEEKALLKDKQQIVYLIIEDSIDIYIRSQLNNKAKLVDIINNFKKYLK